MSIGKYCKRNVVVVAPTESILAAARLMSQHHVGDLVLAEQVGENRYRPLGIVTDRDIVLEIVTNNETALERTSVGAMKVQDLVTAGEKEDVFDVIGRMRHFSIRRMPIVDDQGLLVGIISVDDLLRVLAENLRDLSQLVGFQSLRENEI
ncbi:CBS domain-containing protein [Metapseudomonas lalkuanensis]|uniref:CBS domain-containing protein n=1 Tax=Metapseudomonas lalkuanensis TaxID=2604832 RepID=A0A5J6QKL9_9GAMM|nr:CBS domain-containing protein [Pseudomonas lalkuanensis]QEY63120.1 CBS domain-containing protein [Pseudomonas lalkuanensis]UCP00802.1 CBS domain-containing protein [Pseudomonas lalkuanensis]